MKKIILGLVLISATTAFAVDMAEEGVVLNQELQFLQESAKATKINLAPPTVSKASVRRSGPPENLEQQYFEEDAEEDSISSKAAGRRRRQAAD